MVQADCGMGKGLEPSRNWLKSRSEQRAVLYELTLAGMGQSRQDMLGQGKKFGFFETLK